MFDIAGLRGDEPLGVKRFSIAIYITSSSRADLESLNLGLGV
jgi:hypothetical protein